MASNVTKFKVTYLNFIKCISVIDFVEIYDEIIMSFKHKTKFPGFDDELGELIDLDNISLSPGRHYNNLHIVCHQ